MLFKFVRINSGREPSRVARGYSRLVQLVEKCCSATYNVFFCKDLDEACIILFIFSHVVELAAIILL